MSFDTDWPDGEVLSGDPIAAGEGQAAAPPPGKRPATPGEHSIPRHRWIEVARHIVLGDLTRAEIARRHGITRSAVSQ